MVHVGCVFDVGIHLSKTWMLGSFESVPWNACVHRLDLNLYSHLKEFHSKGKILCTRGLKQDRICDAASCRTASPTYYRLSYSGPGLSTDLTPFICHSVLLLVHLLSFILDKLLRLIGLMNLIFIWSHPIKMQDWKPFLCDFITKKRTFFLQRGIYTLFFTLMRWQRPLNSTFWYQFKWPWPSFKVTGVWEIRNFCILLLANV